MSRQQMIDTRFWDDPWIRTLEQDGKMLYLYLLTGPQTNLAGVYELTESRIMFDTRLSEKKLQKILQEFQEMGKVYRWKDWVILRNWPKHQNVTSPKVGKGIERILESLPRELLAYLVEIDYKYPGTKTILDRVSAAENTVSIPYPYPMDKISHLTTLHSTTRSPSAALGRAADVAPVEGIVARFLESIGKEPREDLFK